MRRPEGTRRERSGGGMPRRGSCEAAGVKVERRESDASKRRRQPIGCLLSGESEIRTRDTLLGYTRFPGVPLQPLEHLSM